MIKSITVIALSLLAGVCFADTLDSTHATKILADKMIGHFVKKEFRQGLALAKPYWPLPAAEIDGLANQITTQWPMIDQRFGKTTGYEFVREERLGQSVVRYYYLHKFENHAISWLVTFYRPLTLWKVNGVTYRDDLDSLFERVE